MIGLWEYEEWVAENRGIIEGGAQINKGIKGREVQQFIWEVLCCEREEQL